MLAIGMLSPLLAQAEYVTQEQMEEDGDIHLSGKQFQWVQDTRRYVGKSVQVISRSVDDYLSSDARNVPNESYLRLNMGYVFEEGGKTLPNNSLKFKADLPKTKNKLSLIFETEPEEFETLEQQQQNNDQTQSIQNPEGGIGAVRFALNETHKWKNDFDVGLRTSLPLDPFVRFTTKRRYQITEYWGLSFRHRISYFVQEGFGEESRMVFDRPISTRLTFFDNTKMRWQEEDGSLAFSNNMVLRDVIDDRNTFSYEVGVSYQEQPKPFISSYYTATVYRRRLHSHWLFAEVVPSLTWDAEHHFKAVTRLSFRLEAFFF